jgi:hypothetical protein
MVLGTIREGTVFDVAVAISNVPEVDMVPAIEW